MLYSRQRHRGAAVINVDGDDDGGGGLGSVDFTWKQTPVR